MAPTPPPLPPPPPTSALAAPIASRPLTTASTTCSGHFRSSTRSRTHPSLRFSAIAVRPIPPPSRPISAATHPPPSHPPRDHDNHGNRANPQATQGQKSVMPRHPLETITTPAHRLSPASH